MKSGYVYLIHAEGTDFYKIGLTVRDPKERLKELNGKQSPYKMTLTYFIEVEDVNKAERYFHEVYKPYCYHNEWFKFSNQKLVSNLIQAMNVYANPKVDSKSDFSFFLPFGIALILLFGIINYLNHESTIVIPSHQPSSR